MPILVVFRWLVLLLILGIGTYWLLRPSPSSREALQFGVTELEGLEEMEREFGSFRDLLIERSGLPIQFHSVPSRVASAEALAAGQVDLLVAGPAEYVVIAARTPIQIVVGLKRADYYCVFLTRSDTGIQSLQDFKGRKLAIGDPGSTSKHLAPLQMLHEVGLKLTDLELIHTASVRTGWEALLAKDVDGFATTSDKYKLLLDQSSPEIQKQIVFLKRGKDLAADLILARSDLDPEKVQRLQNALRKDPNVFIQAICTGIDNQKYQGMRLVDDLQDSDYDSIRHMFRLAGLEKLIEKRY